MVTVLRVEGLRIVIFTNDHSPSHGHVFSDGEAKIELRPTEKTPTLVKADRMTRTEVRRAMRAVTENRAELLQRWEDIHG